MTAIAQFARPIAAGSAYDPLTPLLKFVSNGKAKPLPSAPDAIAFYSEQIAASPDVLSHYWYLGLAWLLQDEVAEAQAVWFSAVTAAPDALERGLAELLQILDSEAECQLQSGHFYQAEQIYLQMLELDPTPAEILLHLGSAVSQQGRYEAAIAYWQNAIELQPDCAKAYEQQAEVWQKLGQLQEAIAAYRQASALHPNWQTFHSLGLCLGQQGQWQEAEAQFRQAIQLNPNCSQLAGDLGWALLQQQRWEAAIAQFQTAVYQQSSFAATYCAWVAAQGTAHPALTANALWLSGLQASSAAALQKQLLQRMRGNGSAAIDPAHPSAASTARPAGFYETTADWAMAVDKSAIASAYIQITEAETLSLTPPKTLDPEIHFSFRFGPAVELPPAFVAILPQGRFWLSSDQTSSAVLTAENWLLGDLSPEFPLLSPGHPDQHPSRHSLFALAQLPPVQPIDGTVVVLAGLTNDMYFHWMLDVLPRWRLLQLSQIDLDAVDRFVVSDRLPFQRETLQQLGIPPEKIWATDRPLHLQATRLIVPSYPGSPAWMPQWVCQWLAGFLLPPEPLPEQQPSKPRRLYISRSQAANRRVINEAAVIAVLQNFGFQSVQLEALSVLEQATLLATAEVVISPHGGGLTNLAFCRPGTQVIELFSPNYVYPCYWLVSNLVGLEYFYLLGKTPEGAQLHQFLYPDARIEDILIDLDELQTLMQLAKIL
ncbi:MAG TPA: glycosyltransferase 61 family protein [Coleofasciculaceae cyanobacterium]